MRGEGVDEVDEMETFPDSMFEQLSGELPRARSGSDGLPIGEGARMGTAGFSRLPQASMRSYLLLQCSVEGIAKLSLFVGCLIGLFSIENAS